MKWAICRSFCATILVLIFLGFRIDDFKTSVTRFLLHSSSSLKGKKVKYLSHLLIIHPFVFGESS